MKIKSEDLLTVVGVGGNYDIPQPKGLIFDKPFLIVFKRKDSKNPYLVAWIDNTELLLKINMAN